MYSKVSLVKSNDHYESVRNSLEPLRKDIIGRFSRTSTIIIKVNLVITRTLAYNKGVELATTPLDAVKSYIDFVSTFFQGNIIIVEEAAWGDTKEGFRMYGYTELVDRNPRLQLLDLKDDIKITRKINYPEGELELPFSKTLLEAPLLVSIVRPKTHCTVGMTAGIKNVAIGAIQGHPNRLKTHRGKFIHNIIATISDFVYPDLVIIDGTNGMEGGGPIRGKEIRANWTLSSLDALAADSLATYLMGFDVNYVGYLGFLKDREAGLLYPDERIEVIGEKPECLVTPFEPHRKHKCMAISSLQNQV